MGLGMIPATTIFFLTGLISGWLLHVLYTKKYPGRSVMESVTLQDANNHSSDNNNNPHNEYHNEDTEQTP